MSYGCGTTGSRRAGPRPPVRGRVKMNGAGTRTSDPTQSPESGRGVVAALTDLVLGHKRIVVALWLLVTLAAFAAVGPANDALSNEFSIPGREGFETNEELGATYGTGGDVAPIVPVVTLPEATTVDSAGVRDELNVALAKIESALPEAISA